MRRSDAFAEVRDSVEGGHAFFRGDTGEGAQVLLLPDSDWGGPLVAVVALDEHLLGRVEALIRFWRAQRGRQMPPDTRMTAQQRRRLRLMMQAADGRADGATYREIGSVLFGQTRIAAEPWKTSALRDMVIGLVEGATALIAGGYLQLLRHRRRP